MQTGARYLGGLLIELSHGDLERHIPVEEGAVEEGHCGQRPAPWRVFHDMQALRWPALVPRFRRAVRSSRAQTLAGPRPVGCFEEGANPVSEAFSHSLGAPR